MISFFIVFFTLSQALLSLPGRGGDRDAYGCYPSAGYRWCFAERRCVRQWANNGPDCNREFSGHCATTFCPIGTQCVPSTGSCMPVTCDAQDVCPSGTICVPSEKPCKITPCPQFDCVENRCTAVQCQVGEECDARTGGCVAGVCANPEQRYTECGSLCPRSCATLDQEPKGCPMVCVPGCFCPDDTIMSDDKHCIKPQDCPCTPEACGPPLNGTCPDGSVRTTGRCMRNSDTLKCEWELTGCPQSCPAGQEYNDCGTACPASCQEPNPEVCTAQCVAGCFCKEGTLLDLASGECKRADACPPSNCSHDQEYKSCGTACPVTCKNLSEQPMQCISDCVQGCFCKEGTILNEANGECVLAHQCPPQNETESGNENQNEGDKNDDDDRGHGHRRHHGLWRGRLRHHRNGHKDNNGR